MNIIEKNLFYLFLFSGLFFPTYIGFNLGLGFNISPLRAVFVVVIFFVLLRIEKLPKTSLLLFSLILCLYLAISGLIAEQSLQGIKYSLYFFELSVAGFLVSSLYSKNIKEKEFFRFINFGFFFIFICYLYESFTNTKVLEGFITAENFSSDRLSELSYRFEDIRATSVFKGPYSFAQILCTFIPIYIYFLNNNPKRKYLIYFIFLLLILMLFDTATRSCITAAAGIFVWYIINRFKQRQIIGFLGIISVTVFVYFSLQFIFQLFQIDSSGELRAEQFIYFGSYISSASISQVMLGQGPYTTSDNPLFYLDNLYMTFAYEFGIFGFIFLVIYLYQLGKIYYKSGMFLAFVFNLIIFNLTATIEVLFLLSTFAGFLYSRRYNVF